MGARVKNLNTLGERSATGMGSETGVLLLEVPKSSILFGKIYPNDVIVKFNNTEIKNMKGLLEAKMGLQLSHTATVVVFRDQALKKVEVALK
jgi:S1-C subfamily serine protease